MRQRCKETKLNSACEGGEARKRTNFDYSFVRWDLPRELDTGPECANPKTSCPPRIRRKLIGISSKGTFRSVGVIL